MRYRLIFAVMICVGLLPALVSADSHFPQPTVSVSSTYSGYSFDAIDDNTVHASGGPGATWASADTGGPHWVEFDFGESVLLSSFTLYWGFNTIQDRIMTSQEVHVQTWSDSSWQTVSTYLSGGDELSSTISFSQESAQRWRLYQPQNMGSPLYNGVLWLTEVDYALSDGLRGDVNNDHEVDVSDLLIIIGNFRQEVFFSHADVNGDGVVNVFDLVLVARDFGRIAEPSAPMFDNRPSGMTVIYENDFTASGFTQLSPPRLATMQTAGSFAYSAAWDQGNVVAYPEQSFIRYNYPIGFTAGGSPGNAAIENQPEAYDQLYMQFRIRYNNWQNHPSRVNKLMYWDMDGGASVGHHYINMDGSRMAGRSQYAQAYGPYTDGQRLYPWDWHSTHPTYYIAETPVNDGEWHTVEVLATHNTLFEHPADGEIQMWVDGVLQLNITDVRWNASNTAAFRGFRLDPVWGGVNTQVSTEGMSLDFDRIIFAGKNLDEPSEPTCIPSTEICDGIDNDCDGLIDEGGVCEEPISPEYTNDPESFASVFSSDMSSPLPDGFRISPTPTGSADTLTTWSALANGLPAPPTEGESVARLQLVQGVGPGSDFALLGIPSPNINEAFVGFHSMFDTNYVNCGFQNKYFYFWLGADGHPEGNWWGWFWLDLAPAEEGGTLSDEVQWVLRFQSNDGIWLDANGNPLTQLHLQNQAQSTRVTYGEWDKVEMYYRPPSSPGVVHDGLVRVWHNGIHIIDVPFGLTRDPGPLGGPGKGLDFISTYGGGCTPTSNMDFYVSDMYVSAPTQSPTGGEFNEPEGLSVINDVHWTSISSPWIAYVSTSDGATTIEDETILQWFYPQGGTGGATFGSRIIAEGAPTHGPVQYHREEGISVSANFQGHGSGVNKLRFWLAPNDNTDGYLMFQGSGSNPLYPAINTQGWPEFGITPLLQWNGASNLANPTAQEAEFTRGESHTVETLVDKGTPGNADGSVRLWLNGMLILHFEGLSLTPGSEAATFGGLHYSPVWGGIGGTVSQDMTLRIDRTYVSAGST